MVILSILLLAQAAGPHSCLPCHPQQVAGFAGTGMGNSLGRPARHSSGIVSHPASGSRFAITAAGPALRHRIERGGLGAEYPVQYFIGSGHQGHSYLVRNGPYLFQSPVSYYSRRKAWDLSPGYQGDPNPDFNRPVTPECLFCHAGRARPVPGTLNRYEDPPFAAEAINCDRCHGPAENHLAQPSSRNIVNPAKLPPPARDSVCEQCHLSGEARIPNPERGIQEFEPGRALEGIFAVYVFDRPPGAPEKKTIKVVSHTEQLAASVCARSSGARMWCGVCHDPHEKPANAQQHYRQKCLACHGAALLERHSHPAGDCVTCHMLRRPTEVAHTSYTDHQILRRPEAAAEAAPRRKLAAWREPPAAFAVRNLGLASIAIGERDHSAEHLNEGYRLLLEARRSFPDDPEVLTSLGLALVRQKAPRQAIRLFEQSLQRQPGQARHHFNLAAAWKEAGEGSRAIPYLDRAIELDPSLEQAYYLLAEIYTQANQPAQQRQTLERYLQFMPQSINARLALTRQGTVR